VLAVGVDLMRARPRRTFVLTEPGLSVIVDAIADWRAVCSSACPFLTYPCVPATLAACSLFFISIYALSPGLQRHRPGGTRSSPSFFTCPVLMFMLTPAPTTATLMAIGYDNVVPQPRLRSGLPALFFIAACARKRGVPRRTLLLLWMRSNSKPARRTRAGFHGLGLPADDVPSTFITLIYPEGPPSPIFLTLFFGPPRTTGPFGFVAPSRCVVARGVASRFALAPPVAGACPSPRPIASHTLASPAPRSGEDAGVGSAAHALWVWILPASRGDSAGTR